MPALTTTKPTETKLTARELTSLHAEALAEIAFERTIANINRRALSLWENGYSAIQNSANFYSVLTPTGGRYTVHVNDEDPADEVFGHWCSCPAHEKYHTCKHLLAILNQRMEDAALVAGYDARQDNDDDAFPKL